MFLEVGEKDETVWWKEIEIKFTREMLRELSLSILCKLKLWWVHGLNNIDNNLCVGKGIKTIHVRE